jgi:hypothetical protein
VAADGAAEVLCLNIRDLIAVALEIPGPDAVRWITLFWTAGSGRVIWARNNVVRFDDLSQTYATLSAIFRRRVQHFGAICSRLWHCFTPRRLGIP